MVGSGRVRSSVRHRAEPMGYFPYGMISLRRHLYSDKPRSPGVVGAPCFFCEILLTG